MIQASQTVRPYPKRRDPLKAGDRVFPDLDTRNAAVATAYRGGASIPSLMAVFPISTYTIYKILKAHNIAVRSPGTPAPEGGREARNTRIKALHLQGKRAREIATEICLHSSSVRAIIKEAELPSGPLIRKRLRVKAAAVARVARKAAFKQAVEIEEEVRYAPMRAMAANGAKLAEIAAHFGVHYQTARAHTAMVRTVVRKPRKPRNS